MRGAPPRLLVLLTARESGGAEHYGVTVAVAAAQRGWEVHTGLPHTEATAPLRARLADAEVSVHSIDLAGGLSGRRSAARRVASHVSTAYRLLGIVRPTVMHLVLPWPDRGLGAMFAAAIRGVPGLCVHQLVPGGVRVRQPWLSLHRWCMRRGLQLVAVSEHNRALLAEAVGQPPERILTIYNGTPGAPEMSQRDRSEIRRAKREALDLTPETRLLLAVGRLEEQKGFDLLVDAMSRLRTERSEQTVLAIAGEGTLQGQLEAQARQLGADQAVRLLGRRDDVRNLMLAADLFVFPSRFEGAPFALLEAMSLGVPIVASDAGVMSEILTDGSNALLFTSGDSADLQRALGLALDDESASQDRAHAAAARAAAFSQDQMLDTTLAALQAANDQGRRATTE